VSSSHRIAKGGINNWHNVRKELDGSSSPANNAWYDAIIHDKKKGAVAFPAMSGSK
jgi:hypothetical protein